MLHGVVKTELIGDPLFTIWHASAQRLCCRGIKSSWVKVFAYYDVVTSQSTALSAIQRSPIIEISSSPFPCQRELMSDYAY